MQYQNSRRVINPHFQQSPKPIRQRANIPSTANLLKWDSVSNSTQLCNTHQNRKSEPSNYNKKNTPWEVTSKKNNKENEGLVNSNANSQARSNCSYKENKDVYNKNNPRNDHEIQSIKQSLPLRSQFTHPPPRPSSAMEDRCISIIQLQLKDVKNNINVSDLRDMCSKSGYHVVKCEKQFNKINQHETGEGMIIVRGVSNDQKLSSLERSFSKKGIRIEENNLRLKDLMSNKYLLHQKQTPSESRNQKLFDNFQKFQRRRIGSFY